MQTSERFHVIVRADGEMVQEDRDASAVAARTIAAYYLGDWDAETLLSNAIDTGEAEASRGAYSVRVLPLGTLDDDDTTTTTTTSRPARSVLVIVQHVRYVDVEVPEGFDLYGDQAAIDALVSTALQDASTPLLVVDVRDGEEERTVRD